MPMASDGKFIYTMVVTTTGEVDGERTGIYLEKYSF